MSTNKTDPRDPQKIKYYVPKPSDPEETVDWYLLFAVLLAIPAVMLKSKLAVWIALCLCISSYINHKSSEIDIKQTLMSFAFSGFSLFMCYMAPK